MTKDELDELKKLCDEATPGPWDAKGIRLLPDNEGCLNLPDGRDHELYGSLTDMKFIAASRTALPKLIAEVERLRADD